MYSVRLQSLQLSNISWIDCNSNTFMQFHTPALPNVSYVQHDTLLNSKDRYQREHAFVGEHITLHPFISTAFLKRIFLKLMVLSLVIQ